MIDKILPIITLLLGFILNKLYDTFIRRKKIKEKATDFIIEIKRLISLIEKQKDENEQLIDSLQERKLSTPLLNTLVELNTNRLDFYNKKDIVDFLKLHLKESKNNSIEIANLFFSNIDRLKHYFNEIINQFNLYKKNTSQIFSEWNNKINELMDYYNRELKALKKEGIEIKEDEFLIKVSRQMNVVGLRTTEFESMDVFTFYDNFIIKAFEIFQEHETDERIDDFYSIINSIHLLTKEIEHEKTYLIENLNNINQDLDKIKKQFNYQLKRIQFMDDYKDFEKDFDTPEKRKKAFEYAHEIRKFEINLYWKRATYFWAFIASAFTGYLLLKSTNDFNGKSVFDYLLSTIGFITSLGWYMVNRASKNWQKNWEIWINKLEDEFSGPLYKVSVDNKNRFINFTSSFPFSVSKVNQIISLFITLIWLSILAFEFVNVIKIYSHLSFSGNYLFPLINLFLIITVITLFTKGISSKTSEKLYLRKKK